MAHEHADRQTNPEQTARCQPVTITTFPEGISNFLGSEVHVYRVWVILSVFFVVSRVSTMILCGEEAGRFAINIVYSLLPGTLAILIIFYSRESKKAVENICITFDTSDPTNAKKYEDRLKHAFSNRWMVLGGFFFLLIFYPMILGQQIYPTPSNNIIHRAKVRDRITVNVGKVWDGLEKGSQTWGWIQLPLGKVVRLSNEENRRDIYRVLTQTPQENYAPHPPPATQDEDLSLYPQEQRNAVDPRWDRLFSNQQPLAPSPSNGDDSLETGASGLAAKSDQLHSLRLERAKGLVPPLRYLYLTHTPPELWSYSQLTFKMSMIPLMFMSGAILWCLYGMTGLTWHLGAEVAKTEAIHVQEPFENILGPAGSVCAAGKALWHAAFIQGVIYTIVIVCLFFARPDTLSLSVAGLFSLVIVAMFVVPQYNLHKLMVKEKNKKLRGLGQKLDQALKAADQNASYENVRLANSILQLRKELAESSEWPCEFKSLAMILGSVLIPVLMAVFTLYEHFK